MSAPLRAAPLTRCDDYLPAPIAPRSLALDRAWRVPAARRHSRKSPAPHRHRRRSRKSRQSWGRTASRPAATSRPCERRLAATAKPTPRCTRCVRVGCWRTRARMRGALTIRRRGRPLAGRAARPHRRAARRGHARRRHLVVACLPARWWLGRRALHGRDGARRASRFLASARGHSGAGR